MHHILRSGKVFQAPKFVFIFVWLLWNFGGIQISQLQDFTGPLGKSSYYLLNKACNLLCFLPRYYSATIIQMSGVRDTSTIIWLAAATASVNCLFTFVGLYLVEKIGRRKLTLGSLLGRSTREIMAYCERSNSVVSQVTHKANYCQTSSISGTKSHN